MANVHFMAGYMGFGKTTLAKKLEKELGIKRFTPDEVMIERFGTDITEDFMERVGEIDDYIWKQIAESLKNGQDVIYDAGFWGKEDRKYAVQKVQKLGGNTVWHQIKCDISIAKQRTLARSKDKNELSLDETFFNDNLSRYSDISEEENLNIILHKNQ